MDRVKKVNGRRFVQSESRLFGSFSRSATEPDVAIDLVLEADQKHQTNLAVQQGRSNGRRSEFH
jgi:predicted nucleotidyltransferase